MEQSKFKVGDVCFYSSRTQKKTLVKIIKVRKKGTYLLRIVNSPREKIWSPEYKLTSLGELSDLVNDLDSVGLF